MRSFIVAFLLFVALVLTVNAAAVDKKTVPTGKTCLNRIDAASQQLALTKPDIDKFSSAHGYLGAYSIQKKEQVIEKLLKKAGDDCCSIESLIDVDIAEIVKLSTGLVPQVVDVLTTILSKKLDFKGLVFATKLVKKDISTIRALTKRTVGCLLKHAPLEERLLGATLESQLDSAFATIAKLL